MFGAGTPYVSYIFFSILRCNRALGITHHDISQLSCYYYLYSDLWVGDSSSTKREIQLRLGGKGERKPPIHMCFLIRAILRARFASNGLRDEWSKKEERAGERWNKVTCHRKIQVATAGNRHPLRTCRRSQYIGLIVLVQLLRMH